MKKILSLAMVLVFLLGISSQASATSVGGVYFFSPYPNSYNATVPYYIGFQVPANTYQYQLHILETNNGNTTYHSGMVYASPNSYYEIRHFLPYDLKSRMLPGTFNVLVECYDRYGTKIGSDSTVMTFG